MELVVEKVDEQNVTVSLIYAALCSVVDSGGIITATPS
jgi:hypothetical protein